MVNIETVNKIKTFKHCIHFHPSPVVFTVHLRPPDLALFSFLFGIKRLKLKEKRKEDRVKENKTGQMEKTSKTKLKKYSKNYLSSYSCTVHICVTKIPIPLQSKLYGTATQAQYYLS